ncbi:MAG: sensor domain-containing diguanylate cyclase [Pseudomonadales bacterium]
MKKPDTPVDEETRLKALRSLNILDTMPEERFDRLTRMAKRLFGVPIALVSLVDEDRQWFKSAAGLDATETPRDVSFCGHAILGNETFIVPDASKDDRFADNPLVLDDPDIRFYAGCPLKAGDGSQIGTLCVIDQKPRSLSEDDLEMLQDLASMAERELAAVQLATLDELTGVSNRRGFMMLGQHSLNLCIRQALPASLVFIDLNKFKAVNDKFGHAEGDTALIAFADQIKSVFRDSDLFARLGGDEFVVLLTNASKDLTVDIMARFQQSLDKYNMEANRGYDILFSYGVVEFSPDKHATVEALLAEGDSLMYKHKRAGK